MAIMCRNHRGFIDATVACSKLGAHALYLNTAFAGPADHRRRPSARSRPRSSTTTSSRASSTTPARAASASSPGTTPTRSPRTRCIEDLIAARRPVRRRAAGREGPRRHPHERHDRHAQGRPAPPARVAGPGRRAVLEDPAARRRAHADRRADVPLVGLRALHAGHGPGLDARPAARSTPRTRSAPIARHECTALAVVPVMLQRMLELPAEVDRPLRPLARCASSPLSGSRAARRAAPRRSWTASATSSTTSTARPRSPGRRSRRPPTCARRRARPAARRAGTVVKLLDDDGREVPAGETGRIFVGNEMAVRGLHGRRRQGASSTA